MQDDLKSEKNKRRLHISISFSCKQHGPDSAPNNKETFPDIGTETSSKHPFMPSGTKEEKKLRSYGNMVASWQALSLPLVIQFGFMSLEERGSVRRVGKFM